MKTRTITMSPAPAPAEPTTAPPVTAPTTDPGTREKDPFDVPSPLVKPGPKA